MTTVEKIDKNPTLVDLINQMKPEIAKVLPNQMKPERMARIATTAVKQTPALARCTPASFLGALLTASQLGLEPGPLGLAYLVPYGNTCTFIPGYRGLIQLARNSGQLVDVWAEIVYEKDHFKQTLGLHRDLVHEPFDGDDRGKPVAVYAAAELKDGGHPFVVMSFKDVEAIRLRSKAGNNGPWKSDWSEMAKKTAIRRLSKWLPLSAEFSSALSVDGSVRNVGSAADLRPLVDVQPDYDVDGEVVDSTPAIAAAEDAPVVPPADVVMATKLQMDKLEKLRDYEGYKDDDQGWFIVLSGIAGHPIAGDGDITEADAQAILLEYQREDEK